MSIEKEALGKAIKQVRVARGLTQVDLAEAAGMSKGGKSIALIEQGKRFVSVETLNALARALDIPPACLAILGSRSVGKNKAATDFMKSLQHLISTVILAESQLRSEATESKASSRSINAQGHDLVEVAAQLGRRNARQWPRTLRALGKKASEGSSKSSKSSKKTVAVTKER